MKNHGVSNGLMYGLAAVLISLISYFISVQFFLGWIPKLLTLALTIFFMIRACTSERKDKEGLLSFAEALKTGFIVFAVGTLLVSIFQYVLYNFIDPSLMEQEVQAALDMSKGLMEMAGAPEEEIEKAMAEIKEQDFSMTIGKTAGAYAMSLIGGFILALITGAITKRSGNA